MTGELAKIIIRGFELPEENAQQGEVVAEFHAMFNPESFGVSNDVKFDESQAESDVGSEFKFKNITHRVFSFDFIIDSTGASGKKKNVEEEVEKFKNATGFKELSGFVGKERRTLYLSITWGSFHIRCVLKSMNVQYTLFRPDGTPIRAMIHAVFGEYKTPDQQARENPESVTNLTQLRDVLDQDKLANMAKKLYGDSKKYIDLAKANGIDNLRELANGSRLEFPPIGQLAGSLQGQASQFTEAASQLVQGARQLEQGKGQLVQSVTQLAASASQQAEAALAQAQGVAQQVQGQALEALQQAQAQGLTTLQQAQSQGLAALQQIQGQGASALQQIQGQGQAALQQIQGQGATAFQEVQNIGAQLAQQSGQISQGAQGAARQFLQQGQGALSDSISNITQFFDF